MNKFIIFYAGSASIEIVGYMLDSKICKLTDKFYFFDKKISLENKKFFKKKLKNPIFIKKSSEIKKLNTKNCVIATGDIELRKKACDFIKKLKLNSLKVIHPSSIISKDCKIHDGVIVAPFVSLAPCSIIGKNSFLNSYLSIGHHSIIGVGNILCPYSTINGNSRIGNFNYFGTGSVINSNVEIKNLCKVSSNSVVRSNMKSNFLAHGNPAKIVKIYS